MGTLVVSTSLLLGWAAFNSPLKAEYFDPPKPLPNLEPNDILHRFGEKLLEGQILGPESLVFKGDDLYTGLMDGRIVRINVKTLDVSEFFRFNKSCQAFKKSYDDYNPSDEPLCGRPLGMRLDKNGDFLVAESYSGLYKISSDGSKIEKLVDSVDGRRITFINDLDVASDGLVYFSETSDRWGRNKVISEVLATRTVGTLVAIDLRNPKASMRVYSGFLSCNGVSLSHNERYVYFVSGPRIFRLDRTTDIISVALDNVPCVMDNIRRRKSVENRFLIGCASKRAKPISLPDFLGPYPTIKNIMAYVFPPWLMLKLIPKMGMVLEVDLTVDFERVVATYQDRSSNGIHYVSEAEEHSDGYVYLGTWHESHLVRMKATALAIE